MSGGTGDAVLPGGDGAVDLGIIGYNDAVVVGRGGSAMVYRAWQPSFERHVAVKIINSAPDHMALSRFKRECQAIGALSGHPNIVTVYEIGMTAHGRPFIVMEYLRANLSERLDRFGVKAWPAVVESGVKLSGALASAHRAQVLHRDVKPENVLLSRFGDVKLADFGIARIGGKVETRSGVVTASILHAPPEVLVGVTPDESADLYSLASTLYMLLAGAPPFSRPDEDSILPLVGRIGTEQVPDLRPRGVPDGLCRVIEQAMSKERQERQPSAETFGRALQDLQRATGRQVTPLPLADVEGEVATEPTDPTGRSSFITPGAGETRSLWVAQSVPPPGQPRAATPPPGPPVTPSRAPAETPGGNRRRWALVGGLLVLVALVATGAFLATRPESGPVDVPDIVGLAEEAAAQRLDAAGLSVREQPVEDDAEPGTVVSQDPDVGEEVDDGTTVEIRVSAGPGTVQIPDVLNRTEEEAERLLEEAGLEVERISREFDPRPAGTILLIRPDVGEEVDRGSSVRLRVSNGPPP